MRVLTGTSGFSYKEWKGTLLPGRPCRRRDARVLRRAPAGRRDQQHLLPDAEAGAARGLGDAGPGGVPVRPQGVAADHAPQAAEGGGRRGGLLLRRRRDARRAARPDALPAAAQPEEGPSAPRGLPADDPRRAGRAAFEFRHASWFEDDVFEALRVARRRALHRRGRGPRDAPRRDGRLGLPAPAPPGLRRRGRGRVGRARARPEVERGLRLLQARGCRVRDRSSAAQFLALG